jgi:hypothetical protein
VYYNEELVTNLKFQTHLSRKLQRFRIETKSTCKYDLSMFILTENTWNLVAINNKIKKSKKYDGTKLIELLRAIRNLKEHERENDPSLKDQSSQIKVSIICTYSENSRKMKHFLFL